MGRGEKGGIDMLKDPLHHSNFAPSRSWSTLIFFCQCFPPCHFSFYLLVLSDFSSRSQTKPQHEFILGRFELNRSFLLHSPPRHGEGRLAFVTRNRQLLHPLLCGLNFFHTLAYSPLVARWSPFPSGLSHTPLWKHDFGFSEI